MKSASNTAEQNLDPVERAGGVVPRLLFWFFLFIPGLGFAQQPGVRNIQNIFDPQSKPAQLIHSTAALTLLVCFGIFVVVGGLLFFAVWRYRRKGAEDDNEEPPQVYGSAAIELAWTVPPLLIVTMLVLATARTIGEVQNAKFPDDALQITIVGHRFWWEVRYPQFNIVTANEIHVPVSYLSAPRPVRMTLESADVVHGFWVPQLNGKTWLVPNRKNEMWIQPSSLGTFVGNCTVFCGPQHANMLIRVMVQPPDDFFDWVAQQQAPPMARPAGEEGKKAFVANTCGTCHRIGGTATDGVFGPDLTHFGSRDTLGSGVAPNNEENLRIWLRNPQALKPGCLMPDMRLDDKQVDQILVYLKGLK
jgi:cytochrome c oxidase subunit II